MPDLDTFDLDAAFERLHRDIASSSNPPGAARAVSLARHRRRTSIGAAAAVVAVALVGATAGTALHRNPSSVGPADNALPAPAELTPSALSVTTSGWTGDWTNPPSDSVVSQEAKDQLNNLPCFVSGNPSLYDPAHLGGRVFSTSGGQFAFLVGREIKADAPPDPELDGPVAGCQPTATTTATYAGGGQVTFAEIPGARDRPDLQFWTVKLGNRLAWLGLAGALGAPSTDVVARVDDALMAAVQSPVTFRFDPTLVNDGGTSVVPEFNQTDTAFSLVSGESLSRAFGTWSSGLDHGSPQAGAPPQVRCVDSSSGGLSLGSTGLESTQDFSSPAEAQAGLRAMVQQLNACDGAAYTVRQLPGGTTATVTVATASGPDPATVWIVPADHYLAVIVLGGGSNPPDSVSREVGALLADMLAHPQETAAP